MKTGSRLKSKRQLRPGGARVGSWERKLLEMNKQEGWWTWGLIELWPSNQVNSGLNSNLNNQWVLGPITNITICCCFQSWKPAESRKNHGQFEQPVSKQTVCTAVKSNALAELMNRASKIHWKNLSLTLNGRNSETKNDKNNPKVPFFQYVQLLRNISFLLKWSFLAKICCCCQMCYFPKLSIFFKMCVVCKMFGLGHNVRFFQNGFCQNVCFW